MTSQELIDLQQALIYVFGPLVIYLAVPLLLALGVVAAILAGIEALFSYRRGPQR